MTGSRRAAGRVPRAAIGLALLLVTVVAPPAAAARLWTLTATPTTIPAGAATAVDLHVENVGGSGGGDEIGCVMITVPADFNVSSASVLSVPYAPWSATVTPSGGATLVSFAATGQSLVGGTVADTADFRIVVDATVEATHTWIGDARDKENCGAGDFPDINLSITVGTPVNNPPIANGDAYAVHHRATLTVAAPGVLGDDTDADGDTLTAHVDGLPANGSLTANPDGSFSYTPTAGFVGTDGFTYHANDGTASSSSALVTIDVTDAAPVAVDDAYAAGKNVALVVSTAAGVVTNDNDPDGDPLAATVLAGPSNGSLTLAADGSFTYTPTAGYTGADQFTYTVDDGALGATGTVDLSVTNGAPVAADDAYAAIANLPLIVGAAAGVLDNDVDPNGDGLTASVVAGPSSGLLLLSANGSFTYTPNLLFTGTDQFTYQVSDGSLTATATATITVSNSAPAAAADSASVIHDRTLVEAAPGVLANDGDANGDALQAILVSGPAHGTLTLDPDGGYVYQPDPGYVGPDQFTYRASDGAATSAVTTVSLDVTNADPVVIDESAGVDKNVPLTVPAPGVLANDTDADGDSLTASLTAPPAHGTLSLGANGAWTYTPDAGYVGPDAFGYSVTDGVATAAGTVTLNVANTKSTATADSYSTWRNGSLAVAAPGVLANDSDVNGDALAAVVTTLPVNGSLTLAADGSFGYTPDPGFVGSDTFTYQATDGDLASVPATVTITVVNRAPVAIDDSYSVKHDRTLSVAAGSGLLVNDGDPDGDAIALGVTVLPANGSLTVAADGSFSYVPDAGFVGVDGFSYAVSDGIDSATASVTITVRNTAPTAGNDVFSTPYATTLVTAIGAVLANDADAEGDALTATLVSPPAYGSATLDATGTLTYAPSAGFSGSVSFTYAVSDGLVSSTATITVTVGSPPTPAPTPSLTPAPTASPTPTPAPPDPTATPAPPDPTPPPASVSPEPSGSPAASSGPPAASGPLPSPTTPVPSSPPPASPSPPPDAFTIPGAGTGSGGSDTGRAIELELAAAGLGALGLAMWAVPGLALTVPGLLLVLIVLLQAMGGLAWLPIARKKLGAFGTNRRRARGLA